MPKLENYTPLPSKRRVEQLCNEHGLCYLDIYVAREFSIISGQPETDVLSVLRRQEQIYITEESGRDKFKRAKERACMSLAHGWETESPIQNSPAKQIARLEFATAYALAAKREWEARQK